MAKVRICCLGLQLTTLLYACLRRSVCFFYPSNSTNLMVFDGASRLLMIDPKLARSVRHFSSIDIAYMAEILVVSCLFRGEYGLG